MHHGRAPISRFGPHHQPAQRKRAWSPPSLPRETRSVKNAEPASDARMCLLRALVSYRPKTEQFRGAASQLRGDRSTVYIWRAQPQLLGPGGVRRNGINKLTCSSSVSSSEEEPLLSLSLSLLLLLLLLLQWTLTRSTVKTVLRANRATPAMIPAFVTRFSVATSSALFNNKNRRNPPEHSSTSMPFLG